VKGYLDPASHFSLSAAAMALQHVDLDALNLERVAILSATEYSAACSGYTFYSQLIEKGPRLASPLIFPHSYPNAAGNLTAIEFNISGPHMVFNTCTNPGELVEYARSLFSRHVIDYVLIIVYESALQTHLPSGYSVLNGAIALWLSPDIKGKAIESPYQAVTEGHGCVHAFLNSNMIPTDE
ncbi:hypothetical protein JYT61_01200, partial [bacterium AH-315-E10]|nr:hypothetical protein [bacterium AH-315-E10]